jgi:hypothetical protein
MTAQRTTNTFPEILSKINKLIADAELLPDADDQLVAALKAPIIEYARRPDEAAAQQGISEIPPGPPPMDPGMMGGMAAMGPMGGGQVPPELAAMGPPPPGLMGGGAMPGMRQEPQMPPPDEFRRMLQ